MTDAASLPLYAVLVLGIIVVPGVDMLLVLASALAGGVRPGLAATAGIMLGGAAHTLAGALGVGAVLTWVPWLFPAMLLAGTGYMAWIGLTLLRSTITVGAVDAARSRSPGVAFRRGFVTCMLNPKAYLFVLAVFPGFVRPEGGAWWPRVLAMGVITVAAQMLVYGAVALAAGRSRDLLTSRPGLTALAGRAAGAALILVAGLTLWQGWPARP